MTREKRLYSGPKSIDDWQILDDSGKWEFSAGSLTSPDNEARAGGNVDLPRRFRLSLAMSWKGRADFVLSLGCREPNKPKPVPEGRALVQPAQDNAAVRLEMWDAQLAVVREVGNLADIAVLPLDDGVSKFELVFYIDQVAGLVAVYSPRGKMLEEIRVAEDKGKSNAFALLENHGKSVSLDRFDVYEWDGHLPDSTEYPEGYVLDDKDEIYQTSVAGFDAKKKSLVLADKDKTQIPVGSIRRIILENSETDKTKKTETKDESVDHLRKLRMTRTKKTNPQTPIRMTLTNPAEPGPQFVKIPEDETRLIEVEFADSSRLVGYVGSSKEGQVRFIGDGLLDSFGCDIDQIVAISGAGTSFAPEPPKETKGTLTVKDFGSIAGVLVDNADANTQTVLRWRPWGSPSEVAVKPKHNGTILYGRKGVYRTTTRKAQPAAVQQRQGGLDGLIGGLFGGGNKPNPNNPPRVKVDPDNSDQAAKKQIPQFEIVFRSGDTVDGAVSEISAHGVVFTSTETSTTSVEHDQMDSITLSRMVSKPNFDDEELKRLMTVPRNQKNDPPTHLLISTTGDYLRGRLVGVNEDLVGLEVRLSVHEIPRENVSRIIWLHERPWLDDKKDPAADDSGEEAGVPRIEVETPGNELDQPFLVHVVRPDKRGVTFVPSKIVDGTLMGTSDLLGDCSVKTGFGSLGIVWAECW